MLVNTALPFELGETLQGTDANGNLINGDKLGRIYEVPYNNYTDPTPHKRQTGRQLRIVALRNLSGGTLFGQKLAALNKTAAGFAMLESVSGLSTSLAQGPVCAIDDMLGPTGVLANDIFWGVIGGPQLLTTPFSGAAFNATAINVGDDLIAATGTGTIAGLVAGVALANATDAQGAFNQAAHQAAQALSAMTSAQTLSAILVNMVTKF